MFSVLLYLFANIVRLLDFSHAMPSDLCYAVLNTSDCDETPKPVFTYYKPGSRCEIEIWRGCPTLNKFENEFECSHACIALLNPGINYEGDLDNEIMEPIQCKERINLDDCGKEEKEIYTFNADKGKCELVTWRGCATDNNFEDKEACKVACKHMITDKVSSSIEDSEEASKEKDDKETESRSKEDSTSEKNVTEEDTKNESKEKNDDKEKKEEEDEDGEKKEEDDEEKKEEGDDKKKEGEDEERKKEDKKKDEEEKKEEDDTEKGEGNETASVRRFRRNKSITNQTIGIKN